MVAEGEELVVVQGPGKACSLESWLGLGGLVLSLVVKYACLLCCNPREKSSVEEEIKEKEEAIRQRSTEVQVRSLCEIFTCILKHWFTKTLVGAQLICIKHTCAFLSVFPLKTNKQAKQMQVGKLTFMVLNVLEEKINNTFDLQSETLVQKCS